MCSDQICGTGASSKSSESWPSALATTSGGLWDEAKEAKGAEGDLPRGMGRGKGNAVTTPIWPFHHGHRAWKWGDPASKQENLSHFGAQPITCQCDCHTLPLSPEREPSCASHLHSSPSLIRAATVSEEVADSSVKPLSSPINLSGQFL